MLRSGEGFVVCVSFSTVVGETRCCEDTLVGRRQEKKTCEFIGLIWFLFWGAREERGGGKGTGVGKGEE